MKLKVMFKQSFRCGDVDVALLALNPIDNLTSGKLDLEHSQAVKKYENF
jgi:hypothetical protein